MTRESTNGGPEYKLTPRDYTYAADQAFCSGAIAGAGFVGALIAFSYLQWLVGVLACLHVAYGVWLWRRIDRTYP